jgi:hypothetical protein
LTTLIINLNYEAILLLGRQIIPVGNDFDKDPYYSQSDPPGGFNIGQVMALGIPDPMVLIGNEEVVLWHGFRNNSQIPQANNPPLGITSGTA